MGISYIDRPHGSWLTHVGKRGGEKMTVFEALSLMLGFGMLVATIILVVVTALSLVKKN